MVFHVVGLPSSVTDDKSSCGFTVLTANFIKMMRSLGHAVYHHGVGCAVDCDANFEVMQPVEMDWTGKADYWPKYNQLVRDSIIRCNPNHDFVCVINGWLNTPLKNIPFTQTVEYAIGYNGTFADYRVFASYAHYHKIIGAEGGYDPDGKFYDTVIPHYLDSSMYPCKTKSGSYYIYMGRMISRKGIQIAIDTCRAIGAELKIAGGGDLVVNEPHVELLGSVSGQKKLDLLQNAIAMFAPTLYIEPFNLAVIEAQMVGTPAITTDFGSFTETVVQGVTGYRCRTLQDFVDAATACKDLDPFVVSMVASDRYCLENVAPKYQKYFCDLYQLWSGGWSNLQ
jgi:glycosyltransferase involved in cell wall biosynthesis